MEFAVNSMGFFYSSDDRTESSFTAFYIAGVNSTLLFFARFSLVSFGKAGFISPCPTAVSRLASTPTLLTRYPMTAFARLSDST